MIIQTCGPEPDPEAMAKACAIAARWPGHNATIFTAERNSTGWLEYGIQITNQANVRVIHIGLIQRTIGAEWESHS